jgi:RNA polymerase sigma factor (TIGR02999 family)
VTPVPFVVGQWVRGDRFYGREKLISEILEGPRNTLWALGTRRLGKTSLLKQLEHLTSTEPHHGFFPLFWDFQGAEDPEELHLGFGDALLDAEERLEALGLSVADIEADDLFVSMARLRRKLRSKGVRLLLLCDEVEELIKLHEKDSALLRKLRHAVQASDDVRTVLASTIRLWALADQRGDTSPFLHGFAPPAYLHTLSDDDARSLILQEQLPADQRPQFSPDEAESIRQHCDNHPYLLQLVCKRFLDSGDLEEAIEEVATDQMVSYFFSVDFEMLSALDRDILRTVARQASAASASIEAMLAVDSATLQGTLQNLQNLAFVRRDTDKRIVLANYFFRRWLTDLAPTPTESMPTEDPLGVDTNQTTLSRTKLQPLIDDRYELRRKAGEGATGFVYESYDRLLQTRIAVKLLRAEYAGNRAVLERFRQEILLSRNLGHPNILRVYHLGQSEGRAYLTMQWVEGPTLAKAIADEAPFAEDRVAFIGARLASALEAAHARRVLHRDIKSHNVMLDPTGQPLITDFGLARLLGGPGVTTPGVFLGTPNYVSPEQAALDPLDERSDLYSLGVVLFEMATGNCPFRGETAEEVLEMHRDRPAPDPREIVPSLSEEISAVILRCLEKEPVRRFPSAGELRAALEHVLPEGKAQDPSGTVVSSVGAIGPTAPPSAEELLPLVYDELRRLARGFLARERRDHTLQPTALVHEAYLRLADQTRVDWRGRTHFFAVGAKVMRRLLIDHARGRGRAKRGGGLQRVTLLEGVTPVADRELDLDELLTLDAALEELAGRDERQAQIVELRFFGGLTVEEVAQHLGLSKRTVEADWTEARNWLRKRLEQEDARES